MFRRTLIALIGSMGYSLTLSEAHVELPETGGNKTLKKFSFAHIEDEFPRIYTGEKDFKHFLLENDLFVDKSLIIQELLRPNTPQLVVITKPMQWGKSLILNMLKRFFEVELDLEGKLLLGAKRINRKLFIGGKVNLGELGTKLLKPLKICGVSEAMAFQGNNPVILLDMSRVDGNNSIDFLNSLTVEIANLFARHKYIIDFSRTNDDVDKVKYKNYLSARRFSDDVKFSIRFLSESLYRHYRRKVFIFVDNYDKPMTRAFLKFGSNLQQLMQFERNFMNFFDNTFKDNQYVHRALIMGILPLSILRSCNLTSDDYGRQSVQERFSKFFGFTQQEVAQLLTNFPTKTSLSQITTWYNSYLFYGQPLHNPWSVMECLKNRCLLRSYWKVSLTSELFKKLLGSLEARNYVQQLHAGNKIIMYIGDSIAFDDNIVKTPSGYLSVLLHSGLLGTHLINSASEVFSIQNSEVKHILTPYWI